MTITLQRRRRSNNPFLGGVILLMMGVALVAILSNTVMVDARASETWPSTTGVVTTSEIKTRRSGDSTSYSPRVIYEYTVADKLLSNGDITVADNGSSRASAAEKKVATYAQGNEVTVYYNPNLPTQSVLEPGAPPILRILHAAGYIFGALGILLLIKGVFKLPLALLRLVRGR